MAVWWNGIHRGFKIPRSRDHSGSNPEAATKLNTHIIQCFTVFKIPFNTNLPEGHFSVILGACSW
jgi:hypothetical protein